MRQGAFQMGQMVLASGACVVALLLVGGCKKKDETSVSIAKARNTLEALGSGGSAAAPASLRERQFGEAAKTLGGATGQGASEALAQALGGAAALGQAELAQEEYRRADADLLRAISEARALLRLHVDQRSLAASLLTYDPSADIDRYEQARDERNKELQQARAALTANDAKVAELKAAAGQRADRGRQLRESLAGLEANLLRASASDRVAAAEQVRTGRRAADEVLKEGELLEAQAERVAPVSAELRLKMEQVERQIASFETAKASARDRSQTQQQASAAASRRAEEIGERASAAVRQAREALDLGVAPAFEKAMGVLRSSASKTGAGRGAGSGAAQSAAVGLVAHASASLQREHAEALGRVAALLGDAGALAPGLQGGSEFASSAVEMGQRRDQALKEAVESYEQAKSAFGSGGSGETGERLQRLNLELDALLVKIGAKQPEPEAPAEEAPGEIAPGEAAPGEMAPSEVAPDESTPGEPPAEPAANGESAP